MDYFLPNAKILLDALLLTPERLKTGVRAAVPLPILRAILTTSASKLPFDKDFYLATYNDVAAAYKSGRIQDLHSHFAETGYFEGRFGSKPDVDEAYYRKAYPDVATAINSGGVKSGYEHYIKTGAAEGRSPNAEHVQLMRFWQEIFDKRQ
jgi:hypothetical protein